MGKYFLTINPHATTGLLLEIEMEVFWNHHLTGSVKNRAIAMVEINEAQIQGMDGEEILDSLIHADWKTPDGEKSIKGIWHYDGNNAEWHQKGRERLVVQFTPDDEVLEKAILESAAFVVLKRRAQIKLAA